MSLYYSIINTTPREQPTLRTFYDGFPGWRWGGFGEATTYVDNYEVGTLVIDMFDTRSKKLIWRGSASDTLPEGAGRMRKLALLPLSPNTRRPIPGCGIAQSLGNRQTHRRLCSVSRDDFRGQMPGSVLLDRRGVDAMFRAKFRLHPVKLFRSDETTIVSMEDFLGYGPDAYIGRALIYGIVPDTDRCNFTVFLRGRVVNPEEVIGSVVHVRDGS